MRVKRWEGNVKWQRCEGGRVISRSRDDERVKGDVRGKV